MPDLFKHFQLAFRGSRVWSSIRKLYPVVEATCLVLMPHDYYELNLAASRRLESYAKRKIFTNVLVVTGDKKVVDELEHVSAKADKPKIYVILKSYEDITVLCKFYRLEQFIKNIVVVSLDEPYGSRGLVGKNEWTLDFIVQHYILGW